MCNFTKTEVEAGLHAVFEAGATAKTQRVQELQKQGQENGGQPVREECGNAMPLVKLDGRSKIAKALLSVEGTGVTFSRMSTASMRGYYAVHAHPQVPTVPNVDFQNCSIYEKAAEAMSSTLAEKFNLQTSVLYWRN